jgi:hypothetical protein
MSAAVSKIFISYSRKDEAFARQLATSLSNAGAYVWLDVKDIPAGMNWSSAIQKGLDEADLMLVILSPDSMASANVENEWQYFLDAKKPVIPLLYRDTKVHFQLSRLQRIDFRDAAAYNASFNRLLDELKGYGFRAMPAYAMPAYSTAPSGTAATSTPTGTTPPAPASSSAAPPPGNPTGGNSPNLRDWAKWGVIVALVIGLLTVLATIAQPFIARMLDSSPPTNTPAATVASVNPTTPADPTAASTAPPTPADPTAASTAPSVVATSRPGQGGTQAASGNTDFTLYWDKDSLTIRLNAPNDLDGLSLNTTDDGLAIAPIFPLFTNQAGTCLRLYRSGSAPVLPLACTGQPFEYELAPSNVFWYTGNRLRDIVVRRGEDNLKICSAAAGKCDVKS